MNNIIVAAVAVSPVVAFWLFSAVVSTMPSTDDFKQVGKGPSFILWYGWLYKVLHFVAGNAAHVIPSLRIQPQPNEKDNQ